MIVRIENPDIFIGLELKEAQKRIADHGYEAVVVNVDNKMRMTPQGGYDPLRVRLHVVKEKVTQAVIG